MTTISAEDLTIAYEQRTIMINYRFIFLKVKLRPLLAPMAVGSLVY